MQLEINLETAKISANGIEFLKLKTEVRRRLGNNCTTTSNSVTVPISSLSFIEDLLDEKAINQEPVSSILHRYSAHQEARKLVLENLKAGLTVGVSDEWTKLLDSAQSVAVSAMITEGILGICLFDEQGSGKTVMSVAAFDLLVDAGKVDAMIVVCPKSMLNEWPNEIRRFTKDKYTILTASGDKVKKFDVATSEFDVLVTNYEGVDDILSALVGSAAINRYLLVVDESYFIKNSETSRSKSISQLRGHCKRCFVLCGTPAPNSAHDLINQFDLADLGYTFSDFSKSKNPIDDWEKIAWLAESRGTFIRRLKDQILQHVPDKKFHVISVPLTGKQAMIYEQARSQLEIELRTLNNQTFKKSLASYFQKRSALLQICSCPVEVDPMLSETPVKYFALDDLLQGLFSAGRKVVLWSFYKRSIDEVMLRYKNYNPVRIDGSIQSIQKRREAVRSFQEDPDVLLFVGNPSAAGAGITLHAAYDAVYLSYSNQAAHYLQSLDRIHRRGQISDAVNYYLLICEKTIEESEVLRLRNKEVRQHDLLGDRIEWPNSLDDALKELAIHA